MTWVIIKNVSKEIQLEMPPANVSSGRTVEHEWESRWQRYSCRRHFTTRDIKSMSIMNRFIIMKSINDQRKPMAKANRRQLYITVQLTCSHPNKR